MPGIQVTIMGVGRGVRGALTTLDFEIISKKKLFFDFEGQKPKFTNFGPPLEKNWENPLLAPPWKKSFRRPWSQCVFISCWNLL